MNNSLTIRELTGYIKKLVDNDGLLSDILVSGEISNFKLHSSGHMYFSLKDEEAVIKCVMFRTQGMRVRFKPGEGMKVLARGYVSVYPAGGTYQLYVESLEADGSGSLFLAFEQLKKKLEALGFFIPERKKRIPLLPKAIGVITSPTGAVIKDILNVIERRYSNARLIIFPSAVQGIDAPQQLIKGLAYFNREKSVDVILLARGGGSLEDLWPFNDEGLAKAIYNSDIPVISAIGHETDFTIADFVADLRAPTPSAAAELIMPEKRHLTDRNRILERRLVQALYNRLHKERDRLVRLEKTRSLVRPYERIDRERQRLDSWRRECTLLQKACAEKHKNGLSVLAGRLHALSPLTVLSRGYSLVTNEDGDIIRSVKSLTKGDRLLITVSDGKFRANYEEGQN